TNDEEKNFKRLSGLEKGLHRNRLISYGGLLKEIHKKLNLDDSEDGDLIHTDDKEKADEDGFSIIAMWKGEGHDYFLEEDFNKRARYLNNCLQELNARCRSI